MMGRPLKNGLYVERKLICACGQEFAARSPEARYCSNACRVRFGQYGRTYGQVNPRVYGEAR